jgi:hypothetical protein
MMGLWEWFRRFGQRAAQEKQLEDIKRELERHGDIRAQVDAAGVRFFAKNTHYVIMDEAKVPHAFVGSIQGTYRSGNNYAFFLVDLNAVPYAFIRSILYNVNGRDRILVFSDPSKSTIMLDNMCITIKNEDFYGIACKKFRCEYYPLMSTSALSSGAGRELLLLCAST